MEKEKEAETKKTSAKKQPVATTKKKKCKPRGGNSPVIGMNGYSLEEGDNTKYLTVNLELFNMPMIDMTNPEEVQQRLSDYFALYARFDMKPTVSGMAVALNGHSRAWLWSVTHDAPLGGRKNKCTLPPTVTDCIKRAYSMLEILWENYMQNGKINPVTGIFLGKNNYNYQDRTEHVISPQLAEDEISAADIKKRYADSDYQERLSKNSEMTNGDTV